MSPEEAREALAADKRQRQEDCSKELEALLTKYGMMIAGVPVFTEDGRIVVKLGIAPREK